MGAYAERAHRRKLSLELDDDESAEVVAACNSNKNIIEVQKQFSIYQQEVLEGSSPCSEVLMHEDNDEVDLDDIPLEGSRNECETSEADEIQVDEVESESVQHPQPGDSEYEVDCSNNNKNFLRDDDVSNVSVSSREM